MKIVFYPGNHHDCVLIFFLTTSDHRATFKRLLFKILHLYTRIRSKKAHMKNHFQLSNINRFHFISIIFNNIKQFRPFKTALYIIMEAIRSKLLI